jgi:uncharacterized protein
MTATTKHAPGTFAWPELHTTNQDAAKKFYTGLFGWSFKDTPMGPDAGVYTIFMKTDQPTAALTTMMADQQKQGVPPHWGVYVTVTNADETTKRATTLGGKVLMEPFDVMGTLGRMAVLQDPTGAVFCLWQAKDHAGVGVLDESGALCWTELMTPDPAKAEKFYTELIGWKSERMSMDDGDYTLLKRPDGTNAAGIMKTPPMAAQAPPHWLSYFQTSDIKATVAKLTSLGGQVKVPPTDIPNVGTFAVVNDPQGAYFGLLQPTAR